MHENSIHIPVFDKKLRKFIGAFFTANFVFIQTKVISENIAVYIFRLHRYIGTSQNMPR